MTTNIMLPSFAAGEITPELWGRTDLAKFRVGASTMRNMFASFRGGAFSRAGTRFTGQSKQGGLAAPPWLVRFQLNIFVSYVLEFGEQYLRFIRQGNYITETAQTITGATQANPCRLTVAGHGYSSNQWVVVADVGGMTELNGRTFIVANVTANTFTLNDTFGTPVDSLAYTAFTSGGTVARIYEIATPYAAVDLPFLKFTQSANTMSLTLVNQETGTEYAPRDLTRSAEASWALATTSFTASIAAPTGLAGATSAAGVVEYKYVVTAVDAATGEESVASNVATIASAVNMASTAGTITLTWTPVTGAALYNVYKAMPSVSGTVPVGASFGYAGYSFGTQFADTNIVQDFTVTPPLHRNPFARGAILGAAPVAGGAGYVQATTSVTVNTSTGSGAVITPIVVGGAVVAYIVVNGGSGYAAADTMTVVGSGTLATGTLDIGPQSGTYPAVVSYFQQRRAYANTQNDQDTYFLGQPGYPYTNFDASDPPKPDDAITGSPWAQQINAINALLPMPGGLIVGTGLDAWQLSGSGGSGTPIEPASQQAQPQESYGFSTTVPPLRIGYNILYLQALGTTVRDLEYNFSNNIYAGVDRTLLSNHLFDGYQVEQWALAREPDKLVWAVRSDGTLLSLTYLNEQEVYAWARHDTRGLFVSVCTASEPPVDAVYVVVKRYIPGKLQWAYYIERMDNRQWAWAEACWCVDSGLSYAQAEPAAQLTASAASGAGVTFQASAAVFDGSTVGAVGQVIRMGGGRATVTSYVSPTEVIGTLTIPIALTLPNVPESVAQVPLPAAAGDWTVATPTRAVSGLDHLEGMPVVALADGAAVMDLMVVDGAIELPFDASQIVVGLPFQAQLQSLLLDLGAEETLQGRRKKISGITARILRSRGIRLGADQPNSSAQEFNRPVQWGLGTQLVGKMRLVPEVQNQVGANGYLPLQTVDVFIPIDGDWAQTGMSAAQQDFPLPMNILAFVPEVELGDTDKQ